ncbi:MAG: SPOR domain-containing protein [Alphaproteobacteria bacterium]|nr:SPOR domain-containing protein [Alphaproteobacteria bacterium]
MRGLVPVTLSLIAAAFLVAGCGSNSAPQRGDELGPPQATLPDVTPTLYVLPVYGTETQWHLNGEVALELQRYDIAASTQGGHGASYVLYSLAEAQPVAADQVDVTFYWDLVEPRGELIGTVSHTENMSIEEWRGLPPDVPKIAVEAASRIINIVPGARWDPTDPAARVAAREERRKLEERRRLYRKMASRGGLGPLSKRIFVRAEQEERRSRVAVAQKLAATSEDSATETADDAADAVVETDSAAGPSGGTVQVAAAAAETGDPNSDGGADSAATGDDGLWAELGTFPDEAEARSYWLRLRFRHPRLFTDRRVHLAPVQMADRGTFYRVDAGPFAVPVEAMQFCLELQAAEVDCMTRTLAEPPAAVASESEDHTEDHGDDRSSAIRTENLDSPETPTPSPTND